MAARNPVEPFDPELLPSPDVEDPIHRLAFRAAVQGADAYRLTRAAVRRDGPTLRLGNRFLPATQFREVAFVALGRAAISQSLAVTHALGDALTQGYVAGPDPLPEEIPFRSVVAPTRAAGAAADGVADSVDELAHGLGPKDLLLLLLSPGALGYLARPPSGESADAWRAELEEVRSAGATAAEVGTYVRLFGGGPIGGRLGAACAAWLTTVVVDRGEGASLLGGGPTVPIAPEERTRARTFLERTGQGDRLLADRRAVLAGPPVPAPRPALVDRPVIVADPAEALREASSAVVEKKWLARLAEIDNPLPPVGAADRFLQKVEEAVQASASDPILQDRRGVVVFGPLTLGLAEGVDERPAIAEFLARVSAKLTRREMTVAAARTSGAPGGPEAPAGGVVGAGTSGRTQGPRALRMRSGITDVGVLATAVVPRAR